MILYDIDDFNPRMKYPRDAFRDLSDHGPGRGTENASLNTCI